MTVINLSASLYCRIAESRLTEAGSRRAQSAADNHTDAIIERAKIASLVWDATMDVLSALAIRDGENPPGRSSYLRQYARNRLTESAYNYWRNLARLHNQQHKPSLPENDFRRELHYAGIFLTLLSDLLPDELRLAPEIWSRMADG